MRATGIDWWNLDSRGAVVRRVLIAVVAGGLLMVADGLAMIAVGKALGPHPPNWATGAFFWALAWSVALFNRVLPAAKDASGPSIAAVALGALLDLIIIAFLVDRARQARAR